MSNLLQQVYSSLTRRSLGRAGLAVAVLALITAAAVPLTAESTDTRATAARSAALAAQACSGSRYDSAAQCVCSPSLPARLLGSVARGASRLLPARLIVF